MQVTHFHFYYPNHATYYIPYILYNRSVPNILSFHPVCKKPNIHFRLSFSTNKNSRNHFKKVIPAAPKTK